MKNKAHRINVAVKTAYIPEQSAPELNRYVFSYTVAIRNDGTMPAKLLTRHWVITDGHGQVQEVRGQGVVGEQPYLRPGERFQYTSGTVLETPVGSMEGSYQMVADDETRFDAAVLPFTLAVPSALH